jgi:hypothetical protein
VIWPNGVFNERSGFEGKMEQRKKLENGRKQMEEDKRKNRTGKEK